ncbi:MAG: type I glyceraldehyde-3-phosphate dehydrogenase [Lentihominibacter sp.]|nr:type I glyceraldehyde-3-phosphate dehydrogenase [Clostridiales bacterium]MDY2680539.1 type I glyceraldehyde-3-phosphate dehydrogenase [Lentihominibacter sp.]
MAIKIGISGFGRISRVVIRAAMDMPEIEIAGINYRNADLDYLIYMLKYDSVFGRFPKELGKYEGGLLIDGRKVPVYSEDDARNIPWGECGAEYIVEGTGAYNTAEKCQAHLDAGAKKVIITAPAKDDSPTFVVGVNQNEYRPDMNVVSNASCTTNCLAPLCKVLEDNFGIEQGLMATIHAATSKQTVVDKRNNKDWRIGRSVFSSIIPTTTGAAKAVAKVIPSLKGKMTGFAYRVPTNDVSVVDLNVMLKKPASLEEINAAVRKASEGELKGVLEYVEDQCVTCDFIGDANTSIFDATMGIALNDKFFKLIAYYDNEFGYSTKVLELIRHMYSVDNA